MNRTAIFYTSCLLIALHAAVCYAADRDRAYQRPAVTILQQASSPVVLPSVPTNSSQQTVNSNDRGTRNNRTMPSQGTRSVQSPPVVDLNDLQAGEFPGIQTLTIVMPPSLFDLETANQEKPEEIQGQPEEITDNPQQEEVASNEIDQPETTEIGPVIAIGYYSPEPAADQEKEAISQL